MKITFRLRYHTNFGQSLFILGNHESLGGGQTHRAVPLQYFSDDSWQVEIYFPDQSLPAALRGWEYVVREADGSSVYDWGDGRFFNVNAHRDRDVLIIDSWNDAGAIENVYYTKPFANVLLRANQTGVSVESPAHTTHLFQVKTPSLSFGQTLCLVGNCPELGNWNTATPVFLDRPAEGDSLTARVDLSRASFPISYKYGVYDTMAAQFIRFEDGENRFLNEPPPPGKLTFISDGFFRQKAGHWRGAGVAIPVFSLRTENSFGVGEFTDLPLLVDWCERVGLKLIQLLPVNDTTATRTWVDSYPYAAVSAFALHPLYLNLFEIIQEENDLSSDLELLRKKINTLPAVDYEAVMTAKMKFVREMFPKYRERIFESADYLDFFQRNQTWLQPYAAFCALRDKFHTPDFNRWSAHRVYNAEEIEGLLEKDEKLRLEIELNYFIQFHLHRQLRAAAEYAHARGVVIKGDLAIGVYRHGADVWQQPELFHTELQAGAPPDAFAVKGQNWGFPTYNWPRMKEDGFAWWRQRFEHLSHYFDAFRIDHILGFFRIWSIPVHAVEGILGYFSPALPVEISEFTTRGIRFDRDRFVQPFITDKVLQKVFGNLASEAKQRFLQINARGTFNLLPEFATQRQAEAFFASRPASDYVQKLKPGLFELISNVILIEVEKPHGRELHFRFGIEDTWSFRNLDDRSQALIKELYLDYFYHRQENFWMQEGRQKLPALKRVTNLLICGEDLGMVPACVPVLMQELGLLSLEIQRMPKVMNLEFSRPSMAPYLSVVTPSTHDMSTVRGWWEEDDKITAKFFHQELGGTGEPPRRCPAAINQTIVEQHLASPAMWSIFQLQDLLGMSEEFRSTDVAGERINVPAIPQYYWRYRMHLTIEELLRADAFNNHLRGLIQSSQR